MPRLRRAGGLPAASLAAGVALAALSGCAHRYAGPGAREPGQPFDALPGGVQQGYATWYGASLAGRRTADGERFDPREMTAAHRTLPFGTWVEVTCAETGRSVRVRITDRGPYRHPGRIIDLSRAAAERLGIRSRGISFVAVRVVEGP